MSDMNFKIIDRKIKIKTLFESILRNNISENPIRRRNRCRLVNATQFIHFSRRFSSD
jgi:hypothetical protein